MIRSGAHSFRTRLRQDIRRTIYRIEASYQATWTDAGEEWTGEADFYIELMGNRYRILHWEFPLEEMKADHSAAFLEQYPGFHTTI